MSESALNVNKAEKAKNPSKKSPQAAEVFSTPKSILKWHINMMLDKIYTIVYCTIMLII